MDGCEQFRADGSAAAISSLTMATAAGGLASRHPVAAPGAPGHHRRGPALGPKHADNAHEIDAWIAIDPDNSVLIRCQRAEMGQGSMTALPMLIDEELQCDWSESAGSIASPNRNIRENRRLWRHVLEGGSRSIRAREDAAGRRQRARTRLIAAAAARWTVPAQECHVRVERGDARAVRPHAALRRACRRRGQGHARQRAGDQDARPVHP